MAAFARAVALVALVVAAAASLAYAVEPAVPTHASLLFAVRPGEKATTVSLHAEHALHLGSASKDTTLMQPAPLRSVGRFFATQGQKHARTSGFEAGAAAEQWLVIADDGETSQHFVPVVYGLKSEVTFYERDSTGSDQLKGAALSGAADSDFVRLVVPVKDGKNTHVALHHVEHGRVATHRVGEQEASRRHFVAEQVPATPNPTPPPTSVEDATEVRAIQLVDIATQPTIVLLSSGYRYEERETFWSDVNRAIRALSEGPATASIDASPWPRYYSLVNIYAVFEPSRESGASTAVGPQFDCSQAQTFAPGSQLSPSATQVGVDGATPTSCIAEARDTNLACSYGTPQPRLLSCDYARVMTLASNAPPAEAVAVLVNDPRYGGTGSDGVAVLSNGGDLPFLLVHELNHALSRLGDEYDYGFDEPDAGRFLLPNCNPDLNALPWQPWIELNRADRTPSRGCTFSNFYRPTDNSCMMRSKVTQMCSVCRERTTLALTTKKFTREEEGISLTGPRCPPDGFRIILLSDQSTTLTINHYFPTFNNNVSVQWVVPRVDGDPVLIPGLPSLFVRASDLPPGENEITATVTDNTDSVLSTRRTGNAVFEETTRFLVTRLPAGAVNTNCTSLQCQSTTGAENNYCGECTKAGGCEQNIAVTPQDFFRPSKVTLEQAEELVQLLALVLALVGIALIVFVVIIIWQRRTSKPGELLVVPPMERTLGIVAIVFAVLAFLCTVGIITLLFYYLERVPVFGLDIFVAIFCCASVVYLLTAMLVCFVTARLVMPSVIVGAILVVLGLAVFGAGAFAFYVAVNTDTPDMVERYRSAWLEEVQDDPGTICSIQNFLECSGFESPCVPVPSSFCPRNCDWQNRNPHPCLPKWHTFVEDTLRPIAIAAFIYTFILLLAGAFAVMVAVSIDRLRLTAKGRRSYRKDPRAPVASITDDELRVIEQEFKKADADGSGALQGPELKKFMKSLFGDEFSPADEQAMLDASTRADGTQRALTLDEVLDVFFPQRGLRPDPRLLTDEEAQEAENTSGLVRLQFQKMERYMAASGALSPERLMSLHEAFLRARTDDDTSDFIEVVQKAAAEHSNSVEADMCRGLTYNDLEGLRCAWVKLHEPIKGPLSDTELERFFNLTHEQESFVSHEHFVRWKSMLDVRSKGTVGWPEFCYPFAQRNLLRKALKTMHSSGRAVELMEHQPRTMTREDVADEFGGSYVHEIFMPFEESVPVERVLATTELGMRTGAVHVGQSGFDDTDSQGTASRPRRS